MNNNLRVSRSIWTAVLGLASFALSYFLVYIIVGGIIHVLSLIPLIGRLVEWFFSFRGDSPDLMLAILCPFVSYFLSTCVLEYFNKSEVRTYNLSCKIMGVSLIVIHGISLIMNLIYGSGIIKSIAQIIAGIAILKFGREVFQDGK